MVVGPGVGGSSAGSVAGCGMGGVGASSAIGCSMTGPAIAVVGISREGGEGGDAACGAQEASRATDSAIEDVITAVDSRSLNMLGIVADCQASAVLMRNAWASRRMLLALA